MSLWDTLKGLADKDREHLLCIPIDPSHVDREIAPTAIEANRHYIRLRLTEMFLRKEVAWFKTWYPAVHSVVRFNFGNQTVEIPNIADASRAGMETNASGIIARNFMLTPAMPFNGGTVALNAGLVALEGENILDNFLKVLGKFADLLSVSQLSSVLNVVQPLSAGIQDLFGAGNGRVHLSFQNSYSAGELKAGYYAAIRATEKDLDPTRLWVINDELRQRSLNPGPPEPLEEYDYMLFRVEVFEKRDDWEKLTSIEEPFQEALRAASDPATEQQAMHYLRTAMLKARQSPDLTGADKRRVIDSINEQFQDARKTDAGLRGLVPEETTLKQVMKSAMPVNRALEKEVPTVEEIFEATGGEAKPKTFDLELNKDLIVRRDMFGLKRPRFHFVLQGNATAGNRVKCGTEVDLIFHYSIPFAASVAIFSGSELTKMIAEKIADLGITIIPRGFTFRDSVWFQKAEFRDGKLKEPVSFKLKAQEQPMEGSGVHVILDRSGGVLYEFDIGIQLVSTLESAPGEPLPSQIDLNLDEIVAAKPLERTVTIALWSTGDRLTFLYNNRETNETLGTDLKKLTRSSLADKVGKIRDKLASVTDHAIWTIIGERIAQPNADEQKAFQECLEKIAEAGWSLYSDLASDTDFKVVLDKINSLEPNSRISFTTDCAFIPWEILYARRYNTSFADAVKKDNPIQVQEIWGYRFVIECLLMGKGAYKTPLSTHKSAARYLSYNLNPTIDERFAESSFKPVVAQIQWAQEDLKVATVDLRNRGEDIKQILQTANYAATFIYVYCHGRNNHPFLDNQTESLELDREVTIDPDFLNDGIAFKNAPIIFLNSCSSGAVSPLSFSSFLSRFREKQALGLVSTSFPVPATFAAVFAHELMQKYIKDPNACIGDALFGVRRKLLNEKNPLGLFYSLQCPMDAVASQK